MKPNSPNRDQEDLFQARLDQQINMEHPLVLVGNSLDWDALEKEFGSIYHESTGRPGLPIRLLLGLTYLKHTYNVSDEWLESMFLENMYWQYFCGYEFIVKKSPFHYTTLVKWRKKVDLKKLEKLLELTLKLAKEEKFLDVRMSAKVNVDTTVQEKAITFPTDSKLYFKMLTKLVAFAKECKIPLRQSYARVSKKALRKQASYSHAGQAKKARKEVKKLHNYLGRVYRDILRHQDSLSKFPLMQTALKLLNQKKTDKNKLYSLHAPEVECISKGKIHKRYEFGCKASLVSTSKDNWIISATACHGNPFDGHTLENSIENAEHLLGREIKEVYADKGYRGQVNKMKPKVLHMPIKKQKTRTAKKWMNRRNAIEPIIGHLKQDHRLNRNYLKGKLGDQINVLLSACGFNIRKLMNCYQNNNVLSFA